MRLPTVFTPRLWAHCGGFAPLLWAYRGVLDTLSCPVVTLLWRFGKQGVGRSPPLPALLWPTTPLRDVFAAKGACRYPFPAPLS